MKQLLLEQRVTIHAMERAVENFKKIGQRNFTAAAARNRLQNLKEQWTKCQRLHVEIEAIANPQDREGEPYFLKDEFLVAEEIYMNASDYFAEQIDKLTKPLALPSADVNESSVSTVYNMSTIQLPRISLPKFTGRYTDWANFRDLFESLVANNDSLSNVQRLHYLKSSLTDEASLVIKNITVTDANYQTAWLELKNRYENQRAIITSYLQNIFSITPIRSESAVSLRTLRDNVNDALAALRTLNRPVDKWDDLLIYLIIQNLDSRTRREWELSLGDSVEQPSYSDLNKFLSIRVRALEAARLTDNTSVKAIRSTNTKSHVSAVSQSKCLSCQSAHALYQCTQFKSLSAEQRREFAKQQRCCYNCLRVGHFPRNCPSKGRCARCQRRHHTLLHTESDLDVNANKVAPIPVNDISTDTPVSNDDSDVHTVKTHVSLRQGRVRYSVLLGTAKVQVRADNGRSECIRALIDPGSESTFITARLVQLLRIRRQKIHATVNGFGGHSSGTVRHKVHLSLSSCTDSSVSISVDALVFSTITSYSTPLSVRSLDYEHLQGLELADTDSGRQAIDLLIGADLYGSILLEGLRQGPRNSPVALRTIFGWVLFGPYSDARNQPVSISSMHINIDSDIHASLRRFWEVEEPPAVSPLSEEERQCEEHFASTHYRLSSGNYVVRLPFKSSSNFGDSLQIASKSLERLEKRLMRNSKLCEAYGKFLAEYETLGHMAPLSPQELSVGPSLYIPHHPVIKESSSTSPLRVVFNASSPTTNGTSLNDLLWPGPKLQTDLPTIILRWRTHRLVYTADIAKMFRQIFVHPEDADYQRILWRPEANLPVVHYRLLTVTYGTTPAPFLAMRTLRQLTRDEGANFPLAVSVLERAIFVDDVLFGADDVATILETRQQLNLLLEKGGFHLRKWATNYEELMEGIPATDRVHLDCLPLEEESSMKVLGINWNPRLDCFKFHLEIPCMERVTKRSVLSVIARFYDPLGWLTPVVISAKILMQELWIRRTGWDAIIPEDLAERWRQFCRDLPLVRELSMPRWTHQTHPTTPCELHGFADASQRAYAAAVYIRVRTSLDQYVVTLLVGKSKVAPIKTISIPRLELCAGVLVTRLLEFVQQALGLDHVPIYCWSDSMIVLSWLKRHPSHWKTFVANRVSDIQSRLPSAKWNYVDSKSNPADCASRGVTAKELQESSLWWTGPCWLRNNSTLWPEQPAVTAADISADQRTIPVHVALEESAEWDLPNQVSSWPKLLRITSYCMTFKMNLLRKIGRVSEPSDEATLTDSIKLARLWWIALVQRNHFSLEIRAVTERKALPKSSKLKTLNPFLDSQNVLRVGGRLDHSALSYSEKHPIILPQHRISELLVDHSHQRALHGGTQLTMRVLRQAFWILGARNLVKHHIHKCVACARQRALPVEQLMGSLPKERVRPARPFQHCGVDYAGPVFVLPYVGRGQRSRKAYIAVFVCLSTKAVHLELVSDYSTNGFLSAFRRFSSRRGIPSLLLSDNGTNFHGAERELTRAFRALTRDQNLAAHFAADGLTWRFIPPSAPHFGGLWEAGVKAVKHHLKRVIGSHILSIEEFNTLLTQIEACLNSRPVAPLSSDPSDLTSLTPGHFLVGGPLLTVPEESLLQVKESRLDRWQRVRRMLEQFWRIWSKDYLHTLQQRYKWHREQSNLRPNEMVIVRNDLLPPSKWELGRVISVFPGPDGRVRVAEVRTSTRTAKRPISHLCRLPVEPTED